MEVSRIPIPALELILQYLSSDKSYFLFRQICHSWNEQFLSCCKLVLRCTFVQSIKQIKFCIDSSRSLVPETVHNSNFNFEQLEKSLLVYCLNQVDLVIECNMRISGSPLEDELIELLKSLSKALRKRVDLRVRFKNASFRSILAAVTYEFSHHWNLQLTYLSIGLVNMDQSNLG